MTYRVTVIEHEDGVSVSCPSLRGCHSQGKTRAEALTNIQEAIREWLGFSYSAIIKNMEVSETIQCPYCGESFELLVDTSTPAQRFTTDCEVCCRPFEVVAECEPGEVLSLEVLGG